MLNYRIYHEFNVFIRVQSVFHPWLILALTDQSFERAGRWRQWHGPSRRPLRMRWQGSPGANSPSSRLILQGPGRKSSGAQGPCGQEPDAFPQRSLAWARLHPYTLLSRFRRCVAHPWSWTIRLSTSVCPRCCSRWSQAVLNPGRSRSARTTGSPQRQTILDSNGAAARTLFEELMNHRWRLFKKESPWITHSIPTRPARDVVDPVMSRHPRKRGN